MSDLKDSSTLTQVGGWIVAAVGFLGTLAKIAYDRAVKRDEQEHAIKKDVLDHRQEITSGEIAAQRERESLLIATLRADVAELRAEVKELRADRDADKASVASLEARLDARDAEIARMELAHSAELARKDAEIERIRKSRERFRAIAEKGERIARDAGLGYAETLADEVSEADEATSQTHKAAP